MNGLKINQSLRARKNLRHAYNFNAGGTLLNIYMWSLLVISGSENNECYFYVSYTFLEKCID